MLPETVSSDFVYIKLFKNIPRTDLEMAFPNTEVRFRLLDKIKLGVTAGSGVGAGVVGTATKLAMKIPPSPLPYGRGSVLAQARVYRYPAAAPRGSAPRAAGSSTPFSTLRRVSFLMVGIHPNSLRFGQRLRDCSPGQCGGNCEV